MNRTEESSSIPFKRRMEDDHDHFSDESSCGVFKEDAHEKENSSADEGSTSSTCSPPMVRCDPLFCLRRIVPLVDPDFTVTTVSGTFHLGSAVVAPKLGGELNESRAANAKGVGHLNVSEMQVGSLLHGFASSRDSQSPPSSLQFNARLRRAAFSSSSDSATSSEDEPVEAEERRLPPPEAFAGRAQTATPARRQSSEESDGSENDCNEQTVVDEFGFILDEESQHREEVYIKNVDGCKMLRAEVKWANIASDVGEQKKEFIKRRCRKGIPGRLRGVAWQLLLQSRAMMNKSESAGIYPALRDKVLLPSAHEVDDTISRDLDRTFPHHVLFRQKDGSGQRFLRNVLHAYAAADPEVGYVQGMGFVVCALSTQLGEEETFWALHMLMHQEPWNMRELYRPDFPMLHAFFYQLKRLMAKVVPRLHHKLEALSIEPSFYAAQWFLTLFVGVLSFRSLLRVWDIFLNEGWKIIFRVALALLKWDENMLLSLSYDELLLTLKGSLHEKKDPEKLIKRALSIKFKTATLHRYRAEYWASKANNSETS